MDYSPVHPHIYKYRVLVSPDRIKQISVCIYNVSCGFVVFCVLFVSRKVEFCFCIYNLASCYKHLKCNTYF